MANNSFRAYLQVQTDMDEEIKRDLLRAAAAAEHRVRVDLEGPGVGKLIRRAQLTLVTQALREELVRLYGDVDADLRNALEALAGPVAAAEHAIDRVLWNAVGGSPNGLLAGLTAGARQSVRNYFSRKQNERSLSQRVYHSRLLANGAVSRAVDDGLLQGLTAREIARSVREFIHPNVRGGVSYAAMRLARTELNNAFHQTQQDLRKDNPFTTGFNWNLSRSHPRPDACNEYADHDPFPKGQVPDKPHPHCFCYLTPAVVLEDDFIAQFKAGAYDDYVQRVRQQMAEDDPDDPLPGETQAEAKARRAKERRARRKAEEQGETQEKVSTVRRVDETVRDDVPKETAAEAKARRARARRTRAGVEPSTPPPAKGPVPKPRPETRREFKGYELMSLGLNSLPDTDPGQPYKVTKAHIASHGGKSYKASGWLFVHDGMPIFVEKGEMERDIESAFHIADTLGEVYKELPEQERKWTTQLKWLARKNPADAFWGQKYKIKNFLSAATAGDGTVNFWARDSISWNARTPEGISNTLKHESGHNMDTVHGLRSSKLWLDAMDHDQRHSAKIPKPYGAPAIPGSKELTPGTNGVTKYGQAAVAEDIAEATRLYLQDKYEGAIPWGYSEVHFRDLFPERAKVLDQIFTGAEVKGRGTKRHLH